MWLPWEALGEQRLGDCAGEHRAAGAAGSAGLLPTRPVWTSLESRNSAGQTVCRNVTVCQGKLSKDLVSHHQKGWHAALPALASDTRPLVLTGQAASAAHSAGPGGPGRGVVWCQLGGSGEGTTRSVRRARQSGTRAHPPTQAGNRIHPVSPLARATSSKGHVGLWRTTLTPPPPWPQKDALVRGWKSNVRKEHTRCPRDGRGFFRTAALGPGCPRGEPLPRDSEQSARLCGREQRARGPGPQLPLCGVEPPTAAPLSSDGCR